MAGLQGEPDRNEGWDSGWRRKGWVKSCWETLTGCDANVLLVFDR
jgi:hypothetical protein